MTLLAGDIASAQGIGPHLGGGVLAGEAAGLDDGYVHFGGFVPLAQPTDSVLFFADGSLLLYNEDTDTLGGNAGLGGRFFSPEFNRIFGGYVYYDRRDLGPWEVDQVGFGLETLGRVWDARFNVNLPTSSGPGLTGVNATFAGSTVMLNGVEQNALSVVEAEAGALLKEWDTTQLKAFVGVYGLFDDSIDDVAGVRGRLEARVNDQMWVGAHIEHDDVFDTTGGFTLEWRFGKGACACQNSRTNPLARLGDPVVRRRHVTMARTEYKDTPLTTGGTAVSVVHVDGDALTTVSLGVASPAAAVAGTVENPYTTLDEASGSAADVVYVYGGVYDGPQQTATITRDGQLWVAESAAHLVNGDQGAFTLSGNPNAVVAINNAAGDAFTVQADDVSIFGFEVNNATGSAVYSATGATGLHIAGNTFNNSIDAAIELDGPSSGSIEGNTISGGENAVYVGGDYTGDIIDNEITGTVAGGALGVQIAGNMTGDFTDNSITDVSSEGVSIAGALTGDFARNAMHGNGIGGSGYDTAYIGGDVTGNIVDNSFTHDSSGQGRHGLYVGGDLYGDLEGNVADLNDAGGLEIAGSVVGGDVVGNMGGNSSNGEGVRIGGTVTGDVAGNTTNLNSRDGLYVGGDVQGSVADNIAEDNGVSGLVVVGRVDGDFIGNDGNGNGAAGLIVGDHDPFNIGLDSASVAPDLPSGGDDLASAAPPSFASGSVAAGDLTTSDDPGGLGGAIGGDVANNTASDNGLDGLVVGSVGGDLVGNRTDGNGQSGLAALGDVGGDVAENQAIDTGIYGLFVEGDVGGDFRDNRLSNSEPLDFEAGQSTYGAVVQGGVAGSVTGNELNNHYVGGWFQDLFSSGDEAPETPSVEGDVAGNTATGNALAGMVMLGDVGGDVRNNDASGNDYPADLPDDVPYISYGLAITGTVAGDVSENTTDRNRIGLIVGAIGGDLADNHAADNGIAGVLVTDDLYYEEFSERTAIGGNVSGNTLTGNGLADVHESHQDEDGEVFLVPGGLLVDGGVGGDIVDNTATGNTDVALLVAGDVGGGLVANDASGNLGGGFLISGDIDGSVTDNVASGNTIGFFLQGEVGGDFSRNTANANYGWGIDIQSVGGDLARNTASGNAADGIVVSSAVDGSVLRNSTSMNGRTGITIRGDIGGDFANNDGSSNDGDGAALQGVAGDVRGNTYRDQNYWTSQNGVWTEGVIGGSLVDNTVTGNSGIGVYARNGVTGSVSGNDLSNNAYDGLSVLGDVGQDVTNNTASGNGFDGLRVIGHVRGGVFGNTANDNGDDGIDVDGVVSGATTPNTTTGNADQGFEN